MGSSLCKEHALCSLPTVDSLLNCLVNCLWVTDSFNNQRKTLCTQLSLYIISKGSEILPIAVQGPQIKVLWWIMTSDPWLASYNPEQQHWQCKDCCKIFVKQCLKLTHGGEGGGKETVHTQDQREKSRRYSIFNTSYTGRTKSGYPLVSTHTLTS